MCEKNATSEDLNSVEADLGSFFSRVENDAGAIGVVKVSLISCSGHLVQVRSKKKLLKGIFAGFSLPRSAQSRVHIGNLSLKKLELGDGLAKLLSLVSVRNGNVAGGLHETHGATGKDQSLEVQARHQHISTLADAAENVVFVHGDVFKDKLAGRAEN